MHQLTEREKEVARAIGDGLTFAEIGERLGVAPSTAKAYSDTIRHKFGIKNKRHIPMVLKELGLI